jgi:hypothetical protein
MQQKIHYNVFKIIRTCLVNIGLSGYTKINIKNVLLSSQLITY